MIPQHLLENWSAGMSTAVAGLIFGAFLLLPSRAASCMANFDGSPIVGYGEIKIRSEYGKGEMVIRS